ncbi:hypothetical protein GW17_00062070 [Ensete ventricosum]|nr:hypothetical protein GW17_00062070 [Ensete ventricosum]
MAYEEEVLAVAGCKGQPATAKAPCEGAIGHYRPPLQGRSVAAKAPCKGDASHLQGAAVCRGNSTQGAATRGHGRLRPTRKRLPTVHSQGAATNGQLARGCPRCARKGPPPAGAATPTATCSAAACAGAAAAVA